MQSCLSAHFSRYHLERSNDLTNDNEKKERKKKEKKKGTRIVCLCPLQPSPNPLQLHPLLPQRVLRKHTSFKFTHMQILDVICILKYLTPHIYWALRPC